MTNEEFKNLVCFLVLMQSNEGILSKSPDYIKEKYSRFLDKGFTDEEDIWGLDGKNTGIYLTYLQKWKTTL